MENEEVIGTASMGPTFNNWPTPEVLRDFNIQVVKGDEEDCCTLHLDFDGIPLSTFTNIPSYATEGFIQSILVGLRFGHAASTFRKRDGEWEMPIPVPL